MCLISKLKLLEIRLALCTSADIAFFLCFLGIAVDKSFSIFVPFLTTEEFIVPFPCEVSVSRNLLGFPL